MKYLLPALSILFFYSCGSQPTLQTMPMEYTLDERDLVPEGIDYSKKHDAFYLTSVGKSKIISVDRITGEQKDFITDGQFGYTPGVGLYIDNERNVLHAIGGYYMGPKLESALYTFDLDKQALIGRHDVPSEGDHFFNDMILDRAGNIYITDTKGASVYVLKPGKEEVELFYGSDEIDFPNGITISDDNTKLYVASSKGIRIFDIATKGLLNPIDTLDLSTGIDGLEIYKGHLYAIQNGVGANGFNFRKLILNDAQDAIIDVEIIDGDEITLDVPLTFCVYEDKAVVIGNSNLGLLDQVTFEFPQSDSIAKSKLIVYDLE